MMARHSMGSDSGLPLLLRSTLLQASILVLLGSSTLAQNCGSQAGGARCQTGYCCSKYGYCGTTNDYCGAGNCQSQCPSAPSPPSPPASGGVGSIVTSTVFNKIFPNRNSFYTYNSFISATNTFKSFGTTGGSVAQKREIAAFLAHISHETSGLYYISEIDQSSTYCQSSTQYPCAAGKKYYGRGPLQISWNYNYGPAGKAIGKDLLNNPDLVAQDPVVAFQTALWFWTTAQAPKPSCHDVMDGTWQPSSADKSAGRLAGFGLTINIINGGIECGSRATNAPAATDRVSLFKSICSTLDVDPGSNLVCSSMQPY